MLKRFWCWIDLSIREIWVLMRFGRRRNVDAGEYYNWLTFKMLFILFVDEPEERGDRGDICTQGMNTITLEL